MDDESFMNFFVRELLWGGNIDPSFSETEDEKAAREEDEKNLSEQDRKKKPKERISIPNSMRLSQCFPPPPKTSKARL
jgi:hypothetical protein